MKVCRTCGIEKPLGEFYPHPRMADGHLNKCKPCVRVRVKSHRERNLERIREYDRDRGYRVYDWVRVRARRAVKLAISRGELAVKPCERCGYAVGIHAHHEDYSKPLEVTWLCRACHGERHCEINAERQQRTA